MSGELQAPENSNQLEMCKRAQEFLSSEWDQWPLPSKIKEINKEVAEVWYIYEDAWPHEEKADFHYFVCIPAYIMWGKKKRDKYLKEQRLGGSNG